MKKYGCAWGLLMTAWHFGSGFGMVIGFSEALVAYRLNDRTHLVYGVFTLLLCAGLQALLQKDSFAGDDEWPGISESENVS